MSGERGCVERLGVGRGLMEVFGVVVVEIWDEGVDCLGGKGKGVGGSDLRKGFGKFDGIGWEV